jgi:GNAT superfamily N-acetyltransferase
MTIHEFFRSYAADRRREAIASFDRDDLGHLVRYTARPPQTDGMVAFGSLEPGLEDAQIAAELAHFRALGQDFEWKLYDLDRPTDLRERLVAHGFVADDEETLMVFPRASFAGARPIPAGCEIRRIVGEAGIAELVAFQERVWSLDFDWLRLQLIERLQGGDDGLAVYGAFLEGELVGGGWTDFPDGSRFPELRGGAVAAHARGRGIYRALFEVRIDEALRRGYDAICVDASAMSRPILERIGFVPVCTTVPMRMRFAHDETP